MKEAEDKEPLAPGTVYFAPPDYHLLVEPDRQLSLSSEEPVLYSRPSIDVLFESAADAYGAALAGVVLTGANADGAAGPAGGLRRRAAWRSCRTRTTRRCRTMPAGRARRLPCGPCPALWQKSPRTFSTRGLSAADRLMAARSGQIPARR